MVLKSLLGDLFKRDAAEAPAPASMTRSVLNVGGGSKQIPIPDHFRGWRHILLDVDPNGAPDVVCDARELTRLPPAQYDAVYCSHNLEHYYRHHGARVLQGFRHILKPDGFAEIVVPDLRAVMRKVTHDNLDLEDVLYQSGAGPITVRDVVYGWGKQIEASGQDFYAHKNGFSPATLHDFLRQSGFATVLVSERPDVFETRAFAFVGEPAPWQQALLAA